MFHKPISARYIAGSFPGCLPGEIYRFFQAESRLAGASMKLKRYEGNPIISPNPKNDWESLVTCNPGAYYDEEKKEVLMLYRASGREPGYKIHFGLARSKDGYHFNRASDKPVFSPTTDGFDAGCVEDAR